MHLIRSLVAVCLEYNILFKAVHIPGLDNSLADAISRFQLNRFRELAPWADANPTVIPTNTWRKLVPKFKDL